MNEKDKVLTCGRFLARWIFYGGKKEDLDAIEKMWWEFEGWRHWKGQY